MLKIIFNLFKPYFIKLAFNSQQKPVDKTMLIWNFIDSNGKRYYRFVDDFDLPIKRFGYIQKCLNELSCGISLDNLSEILVAMQAAINQKDPKGKMSPNIGLIGHFIEELQNRKTYLLPMDIMFDMSATLYMREDENPAEMDMEIHRQKREQFEKDSAEGLRDFFYKAGIRKYIPYLESFTDELMALSMTTIKAETEALMKQARHYGSENILQNS